MLCAKTEYACVALARLAGEYDSGRPLQGRKLASEEGIPEGFLVQILQELKRLGLVCSTRGAAGGYRLARDPETLSFGEALDLLEGPPTGGSNVTSPTPIGAAVAELAAEAAHAERERLRGVTLAEIARHAAGPTQMYYI